MAGREQADALVFFGATGDLAYKQIFPALAAMVDRGHLDMPVIGVAKAGWDLDQLVERAKDSCTQHDVAPDVVERLASQLRYVDGDYEDPSTFEHLRAELGDATAPLHYLAIPPALFATVVQALGDSGCADAARVVVEKPFGHDLASARELNNALREVFPEDSIFRIDHYLGKEATLGLLYFRFANAGRPSPRSRRESSTDAGDRPVLPVRLSRPRPLHQPGPLGHAQAVRRPRREGRRLTYHQRWPRGVGALTETWSAPTAVIRGAIRRPDGRR